MQHKTYSATQAAAILGLHRNTLADWLARGCPAETRADRAQGIDWELSIPAIFEWRCSQLVREAVAGYQTESGEVSKDEADRRRAVAMAIVAEVEADTMLKAVLLRSDAEADVASFCQVLKNGLGNAAHKVAHRTAKMTDPNEIHEFCEAEFNRSFEAARDELDRLWEDDPNSKDDRDDDEPEPQPERRRSRRRDA